MVSSGSEAATARVSVDLFIKSQVSWRETKTNVQGASHTKLELPSRRWGRCSWVVRRGRARARTSEMLFYTRASRKLVEQTQPSVCFLGIEFHSGPDTGAAVLHLVYFYFLCRQGRYVAFSHPFRSILHFWTKGNERTEIPKG